VRAVIDFTAKQVARLKVPYQRTVMSMRLRGLSRWKIADATGRTEDSVKRAITDARIFLGLTTRGSGREVCGDEAMQSQVVLLLAFGKAPREVARAVGYSITTVYKTLTLAEEAAGCALVGRYVPPPAPGSTSKFDAVARAGRCSCGLLLPCHPETCPRVAGVLGYMRQGRGNLADELVGGPDSGGLGTHQGRRQHGVRS
jgi:DNA-binding CsgD family transcriptional regulator